MMTCLKLTLGLIFFSVFDYARNILFIQRLKNRQRNKKSNDPKNGQKNRQCNDKTKNGQRDTQYYD
jgi:hypothetical protein